MWNDIANMSAIATLILFIFYFLGRLWCIRVEKKDLYEKIIVRGVDLKDNDLNIEYVNGDEIIEIISQKYLNWIKVYAAEYVEGKVKKASKKPIVQVKDVNRNTPRYFGFCIPEGIPNTIIEYQRSDYVKGTFVVVFDVRGCVYTAENFQIKTTLKSVLYYLLK